MQVTNLAYFYETSKKVRGGKAVWVKDSNGELRNNVLLGGTIKNPNKGFGHLWAAQLLQYVPGDYMLIFRSFAVKTATSAATDTTIYLNADGYSDAPEVGQILMKAPATVTTTGQSGKVTAVEYDEVNEKFAVTLDTALGALSVGDILVEAAGTAASATATVLVTNPNVFVEADRDMMPTDGYGLENANYNISAVYNKQAWIARMQPLPTYVLAKNRSYIDGIFWI
jgi:hypothetical protein